jgi:hypothetical protein
MTALPKRIRGREVELRYGFQNEPEVIPTERKIELIDALARTGLRRLEVTSFVRPDVIPQLADAAEVLAGTDVPTDVARLVLIPNGRGFDNALYVLKRARVRSLSTRSTFSVRPWDPQPEERQSLRGRLARWAAGRARTRHESACFPASLGGRGDESLPPNVWRSLGWPTGHRGFIYHGTRIRS